MINLDYLLQDMQMDSPYGMAMVERNNSDGNMVVQPVSAKSEALDLSAVQTEVNRLKEVLPEYGGIAIRYTLAAYSGENKEGYKKAPDGKAYVIFVMCKEW